MNGKEIYLEKIKPLIENFNKRTNGIDKKMTKEIINETMGGIIPIVKEICKYVKSKEYMDDPYLEGIYEAYIKNTKISARTVDKQKIGSFLFDINSYVNYHVSS